MEIVSVNGMPLEKAKVVTPSLSAGGLSVTREQAEQAVLNLKEKPGNNSFFVLQAVLSSDIALNAQDEAQFRSKTLGPMWVVAKSYDAKMPIEVLDMIRPSRFTSVMGSPINCGVPGVEVQMVREFDVHSYINN